MKGNLRCPDCAGRGGSFHHGRWYPCHCTRPRNDVVQLLRQANSSEGHEYKSLSQRIRELDEGK